jgi:hypothetical protein
MSKAGDPLGPDDPYRLGRFVLAQQDDFERRLGGARPYSSARPGGVQAFAGSVAIATGAISPPAPAFASLSLIPRHRVVFRS